MDEPFPCSVYDEVLISGNGGACVRDEVTSGDALIEDYFISQGRCDMIYECGCAGEMVQSRGRCRLPLTRQNLLRALALWEYHEPASASLFYSLGQIVLF